MVVSETIEFEATVPLFLARFKRPDDTEWVVTSESQVEPRRFKCTAIPMSTFNEGRWS